MARKHSKLVPPKYKLLHEDIYSREFISKCFNLLRLDKLVFIPDMIKDIESLNHNNIRVTIGDALDRAQERYLNSNEGYLRYLDYRELYSELMDLQHTHNLYENRDTRILQQGRNIE